MSALVFGLVILLMGWFCFGISGPLAKLVTNWNLFIPQDLEVLEAYRSRKRRGIRLIAKVFLVVGGSFVIGGFVAWSLGAA